MTKVSYLAGSSWTVDLPGDTYRNWHHYTTVYNSTGGIISTYVDGIQLEVFVGKNTDGVMFDVANNETYLFLVGGHCYGFTGDVVDEYKPEHTMRGQVDEVAVWSVAFSADEVALSWDSSLTGLEEHLVLYYNFNSGSGDTVPNLGRAGSEFDLLPGQALTSTQFRTPGGAESLTFTRPEWAPSSAPLLTDIESTGGGVVIAGAAAAGSVVEITVAVASSPSEVVAVFNSQPAQGSAIASIDEAGVVTATFTAPSPFLDATLFSVTLQRADGGVDVVCEVRIQPNQAPTSLGALTTGLVEDQSKSLVLSGADPDGELPKVVVTKLPHRGTLFHADSDQYSTGVAFTANNTLVENGALTVVYVPDPDVNGKAIDSVWFQLIDSFGVVSDEREMTLDILSVDDRPLAFDSSVSVIEDGLVEVVLSGADPEQGQYIAFLISELPSKGTLHAVSVGVNGESVVGELISHPYSPWDLTTSGENVEQYASEVIAASSFWGTGPAYHPTQALGPPSTSDYGETTLAWSPLSRTGSGGYAEGGDETLSWAWSPSEAYEALGYTEFIELGFPESVFVREVEIGSPRGMGSVVGVLARAPSGEWVEMYRGKADVETFDLMFALQQYHIFLPPLCLPTFHTDSLRLEVDTRSISDWNYLDYVKLIGANGLPNGVLEYQQQRVMYTPFPDATGADTFKLATNDCPYGRFRESEVAGVITISITPVNDAPVALGHSLRLRSGEVAELQLRAFDADQGDVLTFDIPQLSLRGVLMDANNVTLDAAAAAGGVTALLRYEGVRDCDGAATWTESFRFSVWDGVSDAPQEATVDLVTDCDVVARGSDSVALLVIIIGLLVAMVLVGSVIWRKHRTLNLRVNLLEEALMMTAEQEAIVKEVMQLDELGAVAELRIEFSDLKLHAKIGSGGFGDVWKGELGGREVAVKRVPAEKVDETNLIRFRDELLLMAKLRHPSIVQLLGVCYQPPQLCLVLELMEKGGLDTVLRDPAEDLTWRSPKLRMALSVAHALVYLHGQNPPVVHRDIKAANVLVNRTYEVRVADFGESRQVDDNKTMTSVGTLFWMAPEVYLQDPYDHKADIYSFGIMLLEMIVQGGEIQYCFGDGSEAKRATTAKLASGWRPKLAEFKSDLSDLPGLKRLIERCWDPSPSERPSAPELVKILYSLEKRSVSGAHESRGHDVGASNLDRDLSSDLVEDVTQSLSSINAGTCDEREFVKANRQPRTPESVEEGVDGRVEREKQLSVALAEVVQLRARVQQLEDEITARDSKVVLLPVTGQVNSF